MSLSRHYIFSSVGIVKSATIVFGLVILIIGLRSHFQSAWVKYDYHKICESDHNVFKSPCPDIAMERFYVAAVIICFVLSVIGFILCMAIINPYRKLFWGFDIFFHGLASVVLFIAAVLHIVSAIKISQHPIISDEDSPFLPPHIIKVKGTEVFLSTQKIIAGILTILDAFVYIVCMTLIRRTRSRILLLEAEDE